MITIKKSMLVFLAMGLMVTSCKKDDDEIIVEPTPVADMTLDINGLEDLGDGFQYEGWIMVNGTPKTTGTFTVDANGALSRTSFEVNAADLESATKFILTIEPNPDPAPTPSDVHILAGDFNNNTGMLTISDPAAIGDDFSNATGTFILATPTNGMNTNENSGVWWLDLSSGAPAVGLNLPSLPAGWKYEGWAVINGMPVSTGTFESATVADDADTYSSTEPGPPFPGEDFLVNAPMGLSFPLDLSETTMVISVEPSPDNSASPFLLKPLVGGVPAGAADHFNYPMNNNNSTNPTGSVMR